MAKRDYDWIFSYHSRNVLSHYRASPHLYHLAEDDMGAELSPVSDSETEYFRVRCGFRRLSDGGVCLAVFKPDLDNLPTEDKRIWIGHSLQAPVFADEDPAFQRWIDRNLDGKLRTGPNTRFTANFSRCAR